jgi:glucose/arabinose dehydrogenase
MKRDMKYSTAFAVMCAVCMQPTSAIAEQQIGYGPNPQLPKPERSLIPTVKVADAKGWTQGGKPTPAANLSVSEFAADLDHPRWMHVLPNGDVLVAETNAPERPEANKGIKAWFMKYFMGKAGAGVKSANRITLLRPSDNGGPATKHTFLEGLNSPFGMALVAETLYVANADALVKFPYRAGDVKITSAAQKVADLPSGPRNHHWTKNVIASKDGSKLFVTVGSNSNVAEHGMAQEENRAAILEVDAATGATRVFASGLRNPNGMAFEPTTGELWTVVNERDELGNDLVPDYLTSVKDGGFYGWPYSYFGQNVDTRVEPPRPDLVAKAIMPDYAVGAHTAALGLTFGPASTLPANFSNGAFIGQHGSWNRQPPSGYKVIFIPFANGKPNGEPQDVLTGFLDADGNALGRPVGVEIAKDGALLVADDVGNKIWRVTGAGNTSSLTAPKS